MKADLSSAVRRWRGGLVAGLLCGGALWAAGPALAESAESAAATLPNQAPTVADDPALEARVQALAHDLRCLVCQNESLAESRAPLALDLRQQVREQLAAGKSEKDVIGFLVDRYGDFVLYRPPFKPITVLLWLGPGALLLGGAGWLVWRLRRREEEHSEPQLSDAERAQARALLDGVASPAADPTPNSPEEPRS